MNIILFGFKSCGKTTLGKKLAKHLHRPFYDTDQLVSELYREKTGKSLHYRKIYQTIGKEAFQSLEAESLTLLEKAQNSIISVGGSLILNPQNLLLINKLGKLIYLVIDKETLKDRILSKPAPAFFDANDMLGSFEKMYAERAPKYEEIVAVSLDMEKKTKTQILHELETLITQMESQDGK